MNARMLRAARGGAVAGSLGFIAAFHVLTNPMDHDVHAFLFKVTYLPLVFAGWWFHVRGALIASAVMSVATITIPPTRRFPNSMNE